MLLTGHSQQSLSNEALRVKRCEERGGGADERGFLWHYFYNSLILMALMLVVALF